MSESPGESTDERLPFSLARRDFLRAAGVTIAVTTTGAFTSAEGAKADGIDTAAAALTYPPRLTELQPGTAANVQALLDYDIAADPTAKYLRSHVPIARRIPADRASQASPKLDPRPQVLVLSQYNYPLVRGTENLLNYRYGVDGRPYLTRFAQYQDYIGGWNGAQNIPNPAYVDIAHRNGALGLGIVFQPFFSATPGAETDFIAKDADGNFLVGNKLVDLAEYYGFDGYFLNIEGKTITPGQAADLAAMLTAMHARAQAKGLPAFYLQIYDALWTDGSGEYQNRFDEHNSGWIDPSKVNSMFINYAWPRHFAEPDWAHEEDYVAPSVAEARRIGADPFEVLFFGLDVQEENDNVHANAVDYYADQVIAPNGDGPAYGSLALFAQGGRSVGRARTEVGTTGSVDALEAAAYVWDRRFFSGKAQNPAVPAVAIDPTREEIINPAWDPRHGIAHFITERSVVGTIPFTTRFCTGQGAAFYLDGLAASSRRWYHLGAQDILPTWQWWTRDLAGRAGASGLLGVDFDHTLGWNGGNALTISGTLDAAHSTEVRLFKTKLTPDADTIISLVAKPGTTGALGRLRVGVGLAGDPTRTRWLEPVGTPIPAGGGWSRLHFQLGEFRGKVVTTLSLGAIQPSATKPAADYRVHVGELRMARPTLSKPARPTGLEVDTTAPSATGNGLTVGLSWDLARRGVWYYDVRTASGWLGRIFGDAFVIDEIGPGTTIQLIAVGPDGSASQPATVTAG